MILLDADIIIDLFRDFAPALHWFDSVRQEEIATIGFAAMELLNGCRNVAAVTRAELFFARLQIVWPPIADCDRALKRFGERRLRFGLSYIDALIAETAIGRQQALHTFNTRHFAAYPDLSTIQPYAKT
jgi:predicted nucleic acid-binding protein